MLHKLLQKTLYDILGANAPRNYMILLWVLWYIGSVYILEFQLSDEPFSLGNKLLGCYFFSTILIVLIFSDKTFVVRHFAEQKENIVTFVYAYNFGFIFLGVFLNYWTIRDSLNFDFLVRESVAVVYWIATIPLTVIYNIKAWLIVAIFVLTNSILYLTFLQKLVCLVDVSSILYIIFTIGVMGVVSVASIIVFRYQINEIYRYST